MPAHNHLVPPHGGELVDLRVGEERAAELKAQSRHFPSLAKFPAGTAKLSLLSPEITKNRGIAICAPIAPYDVTRKEVRALIEPLGGFVMVYLSTPVEICERRDRKGLYAKARAGILKDFTGVSDPYENLRMRRSSSTPPRLRPKKQRRQSCYTWSAKDLSGLTIICKPADYIVNPPCEKDCNPDVGQQVGTA